jgi:hypothetical protein
MMANPLTHKKNLKKDNPIQIHATDTDYHNMLVAKQQQQQKDIEQFQNTLQQKKERQLEQHTKNQGLGKDSTTGENKNTPNTNKRSSLTIIAESDKNNENNIRISLTPSIQNSSPFISSLPTNPNYETKKITFQQQNKNYINTFKNKLQTKMGIPTNQLNTHQHPKKGEILEKHSDEKSSF